MNRTPENEIAVAALGQCGKVKQVLHETGTTAEHELLLEAFAAAFWAGVEWHRKTVQTKPRRQQALAEVKGLDEQAWRSWTAYRRELGKAPYKTNRVAEWLAGYSPTDQRLIVDQSITKEWHGLFPLHKQAQTGKRDTEELGYL